MWAASSFVVQHQQRLLPAEPRSVQCGDVLRFQELLEFAVELVEGAHAFGGFLVVVQGAVEVALGVLLRQVIERRDGAVEEIQMGGGTHAGHAFADQGVRFVPVEGGEDVLREAALEGLGEVEVHVVAADGHGGHFVSLEEFPVHGINHQDIRVHDLLVGCFDAAGGQNDGLLARGHGYPHG